MYVIVPLLLYPCTYMLIPLLTGVSRLLQGSDPRAATCRGKLQFKRSKLNQDINKHLLLRQGAENLLRYVCDPFLVLRRFRVLISIVGSYLLPLTSHLCLAGPLKVMHVLVIQSSYVYL